MPSASSKNQVSQPNATPDLLQEPLKSAVSVVDKKLRNLEKRRIKLLDTKKKADKGEQLNDDQKHALKALESVDAVLEAIKDVQKNITSLEPEYVKLSKKDQKRQKIEHREQMETRSHKVVCGVVEIQAVLGELSEDVRPDFLAGANGACQLSEDDLQKLDDIYELVNPSPSEDKSQKLSERVKECTEHLFNLVEGRDKNAFEGATYKDIREILQKVISCGYFDNETTNGVTKAEEVPVVESEEPVVKEEKPIEEAAPEPEVETPADEFPVTEEPSEPVPVVPVNGVDLPPEVQETHEEEGFKFMGDSEIVPAETQQPQEPALNPISPEFVPRNMQTQPEETAIEGIEGNDAWQVEGGHSHQQGHYRGRGGRGRGGFRGGRGRGGGGGGNYRGGKDGVYRGGRGGNRGGGNYRGNREGGRGGGFRGGRGGSRGGRGGQHHQQQQQQ